MDAARNNIIIIAGEASGDIHAAHLISEIKKSASHIKFSGLDGPHMQECGVEIYRDLTALAVVGFLEVLKHYGEIKKIFDLILKKIIATRPAAVILVDYPGFNLRLAKKIKQKSPDTKIFYYISPQIWAWKENRVNDIRKYIDKMLVLFDFEKDFYAKHNMDAIFVGHPLIDNIKITKSKEDTRFGLTLSNHDLTIGLLPGSREKEIRTLLPVMVKAGESLIKEFPRIQFLLFKAPTISRELLQKYTNQSDIDFKIFKGEHYNGVNACDVCVVASGTATLETAILNKPMVVIYKTSLITWLIAKLFIKIPCIGLVNVIARKKIVPECVQFQATPECIVKELRAMFTDEIRLAEIKTELKKVKESLGDSGASRRAATVILEAL